MAAPLILARTFRDAHAYAQGKLGLSIGHYRVVNSPGTLKAVRGTEIHLVEGWDKRPDRFSMKSAMRYCHNRIVDTTLVPAEEPAPEDKRYPLDERTHTIALRYNSLLAYDAALPKVVVTAVPDDTPTPQHHLDMIERVAPHLTEPTAEEAEAATLEAEAQVTQDDEPAEKPKARRRSRCKDCGNLHYKDEPCPTGGE